MSETINSKISSVPETSGPYTVRKAVYSDLEAINRIYADARAFMKATGNPNQWGNDKPLPQLIEKDIQLGQSYVVTDGEGRPRGIFAMVSGDDPTYAEIFEGAWPDSLPYLTLHRVAAGAGAHGIFSAILDFAKSKTERIRIDTHEENLVMQHQIEKFGFVKCGIIHLENGDPRLAYQLNVK